DCRIGGEGGIYVGSRIGDLFGGGRAGPSSGYSGYRCAETVTDFGYCFYELTLSTHRLPKVRNINRESILAHEGVRPYLAHQLVLVYDVSATLDEHYEGIECLEGELDRSSIAQEQTFGLVENKRPETV